MSEFGEYAVLVQRPGQEFASVVAEEFETLQDAARIAESHATDAALPPGSLLSIVYRVDPGDHDSCPPTVWTGRVVRSVEWTPAHEDPNRDKAG